MEHEVRLSPAGKTFAGARRPKVSQGTNKRVRFAEIRTVRVRAMTLRYGAGKGAFIRHHGHRRRSGMGPS
jgi:hypothetical protein